MGIKSESGTKHSVPLLLEIRSLKTTGVKIEDKEMENWLSKAIFTSAEVCTGIRIQQA
jgi:hypothetical protein